MSAVRNTTFETVPTVDLQWTFCNFAAKRFSSMRYALCVMRSAQLKSIGDRRRLAFEIADSIEVGLLEVNIWACDELLTYFDNQVHIPSFVYSMQKEYSFLRTATTQQDHPFLLLGPTTDDVFGKISINEGTAKISFTL